MANRILSALLGATLLLPGLAGAQAAEGDAKAAPPAPAPVVIGEDRSFPRISDADETIYAVQRKAYLVRHMFELSPMASLLVNDRFVQSYAPALSVSYHLAENFALEAFGSYMFSSESSLAKEVLDRGKLSPESAKSTQLRWTAGLAAQWSPIYGKMELWGSKLGTFSFYVIAGGAAVQTRAPCTPGEPLDPVAYPNQVCPGASTTDVTETKYTPNVLRPAGVVGAGVRFYLDSWIGIKLEAKDYVFSAREYRPAASDGLKFTDTIRNNVYAQLGVSFLFGGEDN